MKWDAQDIEPAEKIEMITRTVETVEKAVMPQKKVKRFGLEDFESEWKEERTLMISCGNGGGNMLKHNIVNNTCGNVEYFITDTDYIALKTKDIDGTEVVLFGRKECKGKGAGTHPEIARKAAEESIDDIREMVKDAGLVFIIAGEGGGTGTGSSPIVAQIAREEGAIVVAIVTKPFQYEGKAVMDRAIEGINELRQNVNAILVVDNQKVLSIGEENIPWLERLRKIDDFVGGILSGFVGVTRDNSTMKLDFNDIKLMFENCEGSMFIGAGEASYTPIAEDMKSWDGGKKAMMEAVENAISSPLVEGINLKNAKGVIALYLFGEDVSMEAIEAAQARIMTAIESDDGKAANINVGAHASADMNGKIKVFFILAGLEEEVVVVEKKRPFEPHTCGGYTTPVKPTQVHLFGEHGLTQNDGKVKSGVVSGIERERVETTVYKGDIKSFEDEDKFSSTPENTKKENNTFDSPTTVIPDITDDSDSAKIPDNNHTPSILGIESFPPFLRRQCQ